ncbi:hypothetical protein SDRG_14731 [Saprolegnia diclina VS20]|uniref:Uncharacterized protein n=1 Tax=Saprolegnia diclina (strain VS20) TaxID=1156394 RepID=T0Q204_SAPDV|nr:hypothetical protein SDRG_14731 [Saprolegnia diclina VS20]EQC27405.1 hypothetical protein SDRG_14731 [Saprolegnia diclina VS20]|eukprot:XP_008619105.1 hypothetical protein SDRG_14731 [Saprolegnia diclina VS20]
MKLPPTLTKLTLSNISNVDLGAIQATQWSALTDLRYLNARTASTFDLSTVVLTNSVKWPQSLASSMFANTDLDYIPQGLPSTVKELAMQGNSLVDLTNLPANLTLLRISDNPKLQSIARVQLSTKLEYFDMRDCPLLTSVTIDTSTFAALDALPNAGDADKDDVYRGFAVNKDISTDAAACSATKGTIQRLWKSTSKYLVNVCVLPGPPTTSPPEPTSSNTGLIIGVVVGVLVLVGAIVAFLLIKRRKAKQSPPTPGYYRFDGNDTINDGRTLGTNGTKTIGTNGTGGPTAGTTGTHRTVFNPDPTLDGPNVPSWVSDIGLQCLQLHEEDRPTSLMLASMLNKCHV